jgi:hypothetical protein
MSTGNEPHRFAYPTVRPVDRTRNPMPRRPVTARPALPQRDLVRESLLSCPAKSGTRHSP